MPQGVIISEGAGPGAALARVLFDQTGGGNSEGAEKERNNQIDDQYTDSTKSSAKTSRAGTARSQKSKISRASSKGSNRGKNQKDSNTNRTTTKATDVGKGVVSMAMMVSGADEGGGRSDDNDTSFDEEYDEGEEREEGDQDKYANETELERYERHQHDKHKENVRRGMANARTDRQMKAKAQISLRKQHRALKSYLQHVEEDERETAEIRLKEKVEHLKGMIEYQKDECVPSYE